MSDVILVHTSNGINGPNTEARRLAFGWHSLRWQRIINLFGQRGRVWPVQLDLDRSISARGRGSCCISQRVLVTCDVSNSSIGLLDGGAVKFGRHMASRVRYIFGQDISIPEARQAYAV